MTVVGGASTRDLGLPSDYYRRIHEVERSHWWHRGLREISGALLGDRLSRPGARLVDAGCGTGGFLEWARERRVARLAGADISPEAVALARDRVPEAQLAVAPLADMPFESGAWDVVVCNDVLQHVPAHDVHASISELRRLAAPDGAVLVRTNGARHGRVERDDWRLYDRGRLRSALEGAGLRCELVTHVNVVASLWAAARGDFPRAPDRSGHGIPAAGGARARDPRLALLRAEAAWLGATRRPLPYGHTLLALATPA